MRPARPRYAEPGDHVCAATWDGVRGEVVVHGAPRRVLRVDGPRGSETIHAEGGARFVEATCVPVEVDDD